MGNGPKELRRAYDDEESMQRPMPPVDDQAINKMRQPSEGWQPQDAWADGDASRSLEVACINGPTDTLLSGPASDVGAVAVNLEGAGFDCFVLDPIHADIAYTLGKHLMSKLRPDKKTTAEDMKIANLVVREGLVTARHLVQGRIDTLAQMADAGVANRVSHGMAYLLFANNLVDYAEKYRGRQSVVLHDLEAYADITLSTGAACGIWTVPPFIDSVCHLAGFVMNVSDAVDTRANFCVRIIPGPANPTVYHGDVYVLQKGGGAIEGDGEIVGVMQAIKFRWYPRVLLNRFFSAAEVKNPDSAEKAIAGGVLMANRR
ncbi:hypothetical protein SLS63_006046 [Diaporthe eres]|uniref:Uncharacterized protein n=1 Tax=Diaporthe eres TaxID=83184 RepID=A0ABR1P8Y1_DIAER